MDEAEKHTISPRSIKSQVQEAGFRLVEEVDDYMVDQTILSFEPTK